MNSKEYLFLFTIGPVQSFISQSRKTQDLYAGSSLLSILIDKAMKELENKNSVEFIFPHKKINTKPNRFIAKIKIDGNIDKIGKELKKFIQKELFVIGNDTLNKICENNEKIKTLLLDQIKDYLQIYWLALPFIQNKYYSVYNNIEKYMGSIKNIKIFSQINNGNGEIGRKCSVCGQRNIIIYKLTDEEVKNGIKKRKDGLLKKLYLKKEDVIFYKKDDIGMQSGEGLCGICFIKRFFFDYSFPSTAEIALLNWIEDIPKDKLETYKNFFKNFDEELFFKENLTEKYLKKYNYLKNEKELANCKKLLNDLYKKYGEPKKYYAIIMLDGDNMGRWLSGEYLENKDNLLDFHKKLSELLGEYTQSVNSIITKHKGRLVYAGGDDIMAFVNLNYLFKILKELRKKFPKFENSGFQLKHKSSVSAGIAITHYKTPLSEVLKWTKRMEEEAKERGKRDAFAIAVLKRSGEIHKTVYKWYVNEDFVLDIMHELITELNAEQNGFSNTFINVLSKECERLAKFSKTMLLPELKRLLNRSSKIKDKDKKAKKVQYWQTKLSNLYNYKEKNNFLSFLHISDFITRKGK
ncbi:MAG: type III-B CRISPR-associated protein Cas10/Cmr2 [Desulfonauticus sp.]|nr:type III-B CRISPR-associated protein Cas10/Cmr2 [Desulfonauticus sp.]